MNEALPPDLPGGVAGALGTLRHALADPLSAAGMKLELLGRRLGESPSDDSLVERLRGAKADLAAAGRLIDLLPRLGSIVGETPVETSIGEVCRGAGVSLEEDAASRSHVLLRRRATIDALRILGWLLGPRDPGGAPVQADAAAAAGRVTLRIEAVGRRGGSGEADLDRLFQLPRGEERSGELFLARAGVESDGGDFRLAQREGRLVATLSWPLPARAAGESPS